MGEILLIVKKFIWWSFRANYLILNWLSNDDQTDDRTFNWKMWTSWNSSCIRSDSMFHFSCLKIHSQSVTFQTISAFGCEWHPGPRHPDAPPLPLGGRRRGSPSWGIRDHPSPAIRRARQTCRQTPGVWCREFVRHHVYETMMKHPMPKKRDCMSKIQVYHCWLAHIIEIYIVCTAMASVATALNYSFKASSTVCVAPEAPSRVRLVRGGVREDRKKLGPATSLDSWKRQMFWKKKLNIRIMKKWDEMRWNEMKWGKLQDFFSKASFNETTVQFRMWPSQRQ